MRKLIFLAIISTCLGCTTPPIVDVTKTGKGYFGPTDPNELEVLGTIPTRPYIEVAMFSAYGFQLADTAKMHNAIRSKVAPAGATGAIVTSEGIVLGDVPWRWANGVAIRYTDGPPPKSGPVVAPPAEPKKKAPAKFRTGTP